MNRGIRPGALVAAAGLSSRMGDFKPLLQMAHGSLLETGLRALRAGGAGKIFVVTGYRAGELSPILAAANACEVFNPSYESCDMFFSVRLGLERAARVCDRLFFLPGDIALFSSRSLIAMNRCMTDSGADLVIPQYRGRSGHPVLMGEACMRHVLRHNGEKGLRGGLETFTGNTVRLELPDPGLLLDADTPRDYERLLSYERRRNAPTLNE